MERLNLAIDEESAHTLRIAKATYGKEWAEFFSWAAPLLLDEANKVFRAKQAALKASASTPVG